jgi:hypothetical protein
VADRHKTLHLHLAAELAAAELAELAAMDRTLLAAEVEDEDLTPVVRAEMAEAV